MALLLTLGGCTEESASAASGPTPTPLPPPPEPIIPTYTVARGQVIDEVNFSGRVSPVVEERLFFQVSGRVKAVYVQRDDMVEAGQLLAELENDDLLRQLDQAEIDLSTAQNSLDEAVAAREYSIRRAEVDVQMKQIQLARAQASADGTDLAIAEANLHKAEAAVKSAQAAYDRRAAQPGVEASPEALALERATIDYEIAQASHAKAVRAQQTAQYDIQLLQLQLQLSQMELERVSNTLDAKLVNAVERAKLAVERVQAQLDQTRIISPIAGKVTAAAATVGSNASAYKELFIVADESVLEVSADPAAEDLQRLSEGITVTLTFNQFPETPIEGVITRLPYPYGSGGSADVKEEDTLTHITYAENDLGLRAGNICNVRAVLEVKDDVLWLPPLAVRDFGGRRFVVIEENGRQRRVDVTVGIQSADRVEIVSGLEEGQVVLSP